MVAFGFGLEQAYFAPDDYQQGATVKIMFLHVPSAWLSMMAWGLMSVAAGWSNDRPWLSTSISVWDTMRPRPSR